MAGQSAPCPLLGDATPPPPPSSAAPVYSGAAGSGAATVASDVPNARSSRGDLLQDRDNPFHQHAISVRLAEKKQEKAAAALAKKTAAAAARAAKAAKIAQERAAAGRPPARRRAGRTVPSRQENFGGSAAGKTLPSSTSAPPSDAAFPGVPLSTALESVNRRAVAVAFRDGESTQSPVAHSAPAATPSAADNPTEVTHPMGSTIPPAAVVPAACNTTPANGRGPPQLTSTLLSPSSDAATPSTTLAAAATSSAARAAAAAAAVLADAAVVTGSRPRPTVFEAAGSAAFNECNCAAAASNRHLREQVEDLKTAIECNKRLRKQLDEHEQESKKRRVATNRQIKELRKAAAAIQSEVGAVKTTMKAVVKTINLVGTAVNHGNAAMKDLCKAVDRRDARVGTNAPTSHTTSMVTASVLSELRQAPWTQQLMVRVTFGSISLVLFLYAC